MTKKALTKLEDKMELALTKIKLRINSFHVTRYYCIWHCGKLQVSYLLKEQKFELLDIINDFGNYKVLYYGNDFDDLIEEIKIYVNRKENLK